MVIPNKNFYKMKFFLDLRPNLMEKLKYLKIMSIIKKHVCKLKELKFKMLVKTIILFFIVLILFIPTSLLKSNKCAEQTYNDNSLINY